jgi:maltose O-acetyltransferase
MKTEKEKMLAGKLYTAMDEELGKDHIKAQEILAEFNVSLWKTKATF